MHVPRANQCTCKISRLPDDCLIILPLVLHELFEPRHVCR